jgi:hypothetical protein
VITQPNDGPREGLPVGFGIIQLDLRAQTKSSQSRTADIVVAYDTLSGKHLGWWLKTLWNTLPYPSRVDTAFVLCHETGAPWTSHSFRYTYVYPLLALQRTLGDAYLSKFDKTIGKGLAEKLVI